MAHKARAIFSEHELTICHIALQFSTAEWILVQLSSGFNKVPSAGTLHFGLSYKFQRNSHIMARLWIGISDNI